MIPKAITAPFRWWAKHPWMVFWAIILPAPLSTIIFLSNDLLLSNDILFCVHVISLLVLPIAWILSFSQEVWQRSKVRVVLAVAAFVIPIKLIIISPMLSHHPTYNPDADVKSNLQNVAMAQEGYWNDHLSPIN